MSHPVIPTEVRERVISAADELYQQTGRERFPTVDAVRRASRADMNTVSVLMKEWRQAQTAQAAPVAVAVPEVVQNASSSALAALWQQATDLANQSLRAAQAGWEAERQDLDDMRAELSGSFEAQAIELDAAKALGADLAAKLELEQGQRAAAVSRFEKLIADLQAQLALATERAHTAEARVVEISKRADDLKTMLDDSQNTAKANAVRADAIAVELSAVTAKAEASQQMHQEQIAATMTRLDAVVAELATTKANADAAERSHAEQRKAAAVETQRVADRMVKLDAELTTARKEAAAAREESARLQGQNEAMKAQAAEFMRALAAVKKS